MKQTEIEAELKSFGARVDQALRGWLPPGTTHPPKLHQAMCYAVLTGGKRIRPALIYATGRALGCELAVLDGPACAVELIHAYSLIHDDLPAMDDDDLRRGKPTCHKAFDEATAILAGDAIQALAFYILAHDPRMVNAPAIRLRMIETLARAAGSRGMAGGQAIDLAAVGRPLGIVELEDMHLRKTGALIRASVTLAALSRIAIEPGSLQSLDRFAKCIGLAFQIRDDILDVEGETATLGKTRGADSARDKPTYPSLLGMAETKTRLHSLRDEALQSLADFDERAELLCGIAGYIADRKS